MKIGDRIFWDTVLIISTITLPWWIPTLTAIYLFFVFNNYYELVFLGLFFDAIYGIGVGSEHKNLPIFFVVSLCIYLVLNIFKNHLRYHA